MNVNYPKIYRQAILAGWLLMTLVIHTDLVFAQIQKENKAQIDVFTDSLGYDADKEDKKERRQQYYEQMHRTAPDVDWKRMDQHARIAKAKSRFQRVRTQRQLGSGIEVIAGGKLQGIWHEIGSKNLAGRIHLAEYDPDNDQIYLASAGGHIWKSSSDGSDWQACNDLMRIPEIIHLRLIPQGNQKRIIVASYNAQFGVMYSDDDGLTWNFANGLDNVKNWGYLDKMVVANNSEHTVYVLVNEWDFQNWGGITSVYASYDHGENFTKLQSFRHDAFGDAHFFDIWTDHYGSGKVYLLENNRIRKLKNNQFHIVSQVPLIANGNDLRLTGSEMGRGTFLYALYVRTNNTSDIYQSKNGGKNWTFKGTISQLPFHRNSFACSRANRKHIFLGGVDCFRSMDEGATWQRVNGWGEYYGNPASKLHADICGINTFVTNNGQAFVLISTDGGTYISENDMLSVENISLSGLNVSQYYSVYTNRNNTEVIYAGSQDQGLQRSDVDNGGIRDFEQMISGDYGHIVSGDGGESIWANFPGFSIYYPDASENSMYRRWNFIGSDYLWLPPLVANPESPNTVFLGGGSVTGTGTHILRLQAGGGGVQYEQLPYSFAGGSISAMAISPIDPDYRYVMTDAGWFYHSSDGGMNWTRSAGFDGPDAHYFYGASILPSKSELGRVYISGSGYSNPAVFMSDNHGQTFTPLRNNLPSTLVFQIDATFDDAMLFAATEVGPYVYIEEDRRWYEMSGVTAPDQTYWTVDYLPELNTVRFGTYGRGIFDFEIGTEPGAVAEVLYRVNAGGRSFSDDPDWDPDTNKFPSSYRTGGIRGSTNEVAISLDGSVPVGVPSDLFTTKRYWQAGKKAMTWAFPVESGKEVDVRIYLAETNFQAAGQRVFDILIDGVLVENNIDVYGLVGHGVGMMRSYEMVSDGMVNISFGREVDNPAIKGIEIVGVVGSQRQPPIAASVLNQMLKNADEKNNESVAQDADQLHIFPNPAMQKVHIVFRGNETSLTMIEMFNMLGHPVHRIDRNGNVEEEVDVSRFHKGVYVVRAVTEGRIITKRFIIE